MAGHSKWANIKHKKARTDAKKGKVFSRITKEIITAVKLGGPDPKGNQRLKLVLQKAKTVNMPSDNVERNIKKATSQDQSDYHEVNYEIYGVGGVGIFCEAMTDNKNRLSSDMRIISNKTQASIATPGSVAFNFERKGVIQIPRAHAIEDDLFLLVSDAGATDFEVQEEMYVVITEPQDLHAVCEVLQEQSIAFEEAELEMIPKSLIECSDEEREANLAILERLEELDDVDQVYHNMQL
jgi:YebC/PmpR family DNA-binding regulatory protein